MSWKIEDCRRLKRLGRGGIYTPVSRDHKNKEIGEYMNVWFVPNLTAKK